MKIRQYIPILAASTAFLAGSPEEANAGGRTRQYTPPIMQNQIAQYFEGSNIDPRLKIAGIGAGVLAIIAIGVGGSYKREHKNGYLPDEDDD